MINPYPNRVLTLAASLLGLAVLALLIAIALANNGVGEYQLRAVEAVSGWAFNAGFMAMLAWLVLKGVAWRAEDARTQLEDTADRL